MANKIRYIGSKEKLLPFIKATVDKKIENCSGITFCDLFSGIGSVSRYFKPLVKQLISNDFEYYAYSVLYNYVKNNKHYDLDDFFNTLNKLEPQEGFIYENYSENAGRMYFTDENARKIDSARIFLNDTRAEYGDDIFYSGLCALLEAVDAVANTPGVYKSFLKKLQSNAKKNLYIEYKPASIGQNEAILYNEDSGELIKRIEGDVLYLDPPYSPLQYSGFYHLLNTIAKYDKFDVTGITGNRTLVKQENKSDWCSKIRAESALINIIENAKFEWIFMSYNDEGIIKFDKIKEILSSYGDYSSEEMLYKRYTAGRMSSDKKHVIEYIHVLHKLR
jgi:adenine-specific DNA-methyltransferase